MQAHAAAKDSAAVNGSHRHQSTANAEEIYPSSVAMGGFSWSAPVPSPQQEDRTATFGAGTTYDYSAYFGIAPHSRMSFAAPGDVSGGGRSTSQLWSARLPSRSTSFGGFSAIKTEDSSQDDS